LTELPPEKPPISTPETPEPSPFRYVFLGPHGLRAGWGVLLFAALFSLLANIGLRAIAHLHLKLTLNYRMALGEILVCATGLAATAIMAALEKRKLTAYGLAPQGGLPKFTGGVILGFAFLSLLMATLAIFKAYALGNLAIHGMQIAKYAVIWAFAFTLVAVYEETLFRGYALTTLTRGIGFWPAALLLSALFGYTHSGNTGESWFGLVSAGLAGLVLCFGIRRTGSLWWAIGFHAMWDYSQSFLYSTLDSGLPITGHLLNSHFQGPAWLTGGSVGPEGSYLVLPVLLVVAATIHVLYPASKTEPAPATQ
jgi:membrane protease YdiL (CAAX protease family)